MITLLTLHTANTESLHVLIQSSNLSNKHKNILHNQFARQSRRDPHCRYAACSLGISQLGTVLYSLLVIDE